MGPTARPTTSSRRRHPPRSFQVLRILLRYRSFAARRPTTGTIHRGHRSKPATGRLSSSPRDGGQSATVRSFERVEYRGTTAQRRRRWWFCSNSVEQENVRWQRQQSSTSRAHRKPILPAELSGVFFERAGIRYRLHHESWQRYEPPFITRSRPRAGPVGL